MHSTRKMLYRYIATGSFTHTHTHTYNIGTFVLQVVGRGFVVETRRKVRRRVVSEPVGPMQRSGETFGRHQKRRETKRQSRRGVGVAVQAL